jgi:hypothetical protein
VPRPSSARRASSSPTARSNSVALARRERDAEHVGQPRRVQLQLRGEIAQAAGDDGHRRRVGQRRARGLAFEHGRQRAALDAAAQQFVDRRLVGAARGRQAQLDREAAPVDRTHLDADVADLARTGGEADAGHALQRLAHARTGRARGAPGGLSRRSRSS